ncbi:MAG: hypothetical protein WBL28_08010 [Methylotenera sp.]
MAEQNLNQDEMNERLSIFHDAICASSLEEKGRLLHHHHELINIVNYYAAAVKSHAPSNKEFWDKFNSGNYERTLAGDIRENHLNMYGHLLRFKLKVILYL